VLPHLLGEFDRISYNFVKIVKINEKCENVQENMMVDFRHNLEDPHFWRKSRFQRFLRSGDGLWGIGTSKVRLLKYLRVDKFLFRTGFDRFLPKFENFHEFLSIFIDFWCFRLFLKSGFEHVKFVWVNKHT